MKKLALSLALALVSAGISSGCPAKEQDESFIVDTSDIGKDTHGVVTSDQFLELGCPTASALRIEGEQSMRMGNLNRAIMVLQRSIELSPQDMDSRILYGEALERKLIRQKVRDPKLYNYTLKQWLFVAKNAEFSDQGLQGYNHLYKLSGVVPKRWEKERKYLEKVLIPEDGSVKVVIGKRPTSM